MIKRGTLPPVLAAIGFAGALAAQAGEVTPAPAVHRVFGPQHMFRLSEEAIADLHKCKPNALECVENAVKRHGGSREAFEFYRRTGWFLSELKDGGGPVMLAKIVDPWRANENEQPALVGGKPDIVYPEKADVALENDAGFKALKAEFPKLMFWKSGPTFESDTIREDGESVVFRYRLLDGCHACEVRGWARVAFEFAPDGAYRRSKLFGVVRD